MSLLEWFSDDKRVLVVAPEESRPATINLALAHGLAYRGDRDLWVAVPEGIQGPTLRRAAFLEPSIRVWTHRDWMPVEQILPARAEVLQSLKPPIAGAAVHLDDRAEWIAPLLGWAASAPGVAATHSGDYLGYHYNGRMVLKIRPTADHRLVVSAGVHHIEGDSLITATLDGPMAAAQFPVFVGTADRACATYRAARDAVNADHRLQSLLTVGHLGLCAMRREFPTRLQTFGAWDGDGPGFIDYVGIDAQGHLHVVAVKVGGDAMFVMRGLDYWTWAMANCEALAEHFGLEATPPVYLDFVAAPKSPSVRPVGPYVAEQAEALLGEIPWRFHLATAQHDSSLQVIALSSRTVPDGAPRRSTPGWSRRLGAHVALHAAADGHTLRAGVFYPSATDGLSVAARAVHAELTVADLNHRMVGHVRSSQAFALNLFAGLDDPARLAVLRRLGVWATACDPPLFEVSDPDDRLGEKTAASPHATQVDVVLRATDDDRKRYLVLIEVKLSENDFGHCSAFQSERNPDRCACRQPHPFGGDTTGCFQLRNHDRGEPRRYDKVLGPFTSQPSGNGCWWRLGANQPMRNVALAKLWVDSGDTNMAVVAMCAPLAHGAIWRRWIEASSILDAGPKVSLASLPADCVSE